MCVRIQNVRLNQDNSEEPSGEAPSRSPFHRNAKPIQRKPKKAVSTPVEQGRLMNYHNFASRLSIQRLSAANSAKSVAKPEPRKVRRPARRPFTTAATAAAALVLVLCTLTPRAEAAENDGARAARPAVWRVNAPTLFVTLTGLGVALLRVPALWRRDLDC